MRKADALMDRKKAAKLIKRQKNEQQKFANAADLQKTVRANQTREMVEIRRFGSLEPMESAEACLSSLAMRLPLLPLKAHRAIELQGNEFHPVAPIRRTVSAELDKPPSSFLTKAALALLN